MVAATPPDPTSTPAAMRRIHNMRRERRVCFPHALDPKAAALDPLGGSRGLDHRQGSDDAPLARMRLDSDGRSLVDELAGEIQLRIMSGAIPVGVRLRHETLAAEFGVSRTPVREALRKLEASGVIELIPRRGALVRGPTARDI